MSSHRGAVKAEADSPKKESKKPAAAKANGSKAKADKPNGEPQKGPVMSGAQIVVES
jgi:hypothetical protein